MGEGGKEGERKGKEIEGEDGDPQGLVHTTPMFAS